MPLTDGEHEAAAKLIDHLAQLAAWHHAMDHSNRADDPSPWELCQHATCRASWANVRSTTQTLGLPPRVGLYVFTGNGNELVLLSSHRDLEAAKTRMEHEAEATNKPIRDFRIMPL